LIRITANIVIDDREIDERFVRASGPGGQNVNKSLDRGRAPVRRRRLVASI
jgi:protein subunit release factor A